MRTTSRHWMTAAAVTLVLSLLTPPAGAEALKYLPKDTEVVVSFNLRQVLNSQLAKDNKAVVTQLINFLEASLESDTKYAKLKQDLGFDLFKDLNGVTVAASSLKSPDDVVIVVEGQFNADKLHAAAANFARQAPDAFKVHSEGGRQIYEMTPKGKDEPSFAALADGKTLVMAKTKAQLTEALERQTAGLSENVNKLLKTTSPKNGIAFVATSAALEKAADNNPQAAAFKKMLPKMHGMTMTATLESDLRFQMAAVAKDTDAAKELAEETRQGVGFLQLMANNVAQQNEQMAPVAGIAQSLRVTTEGPDMFLRGQVASRVLEGLLKQAEAFLP